MSEYDKELQSNTDEYEEAIEPLERETRRKEEERSGDADGGSEGGPSK